MKKSIIYLIFSTLIINFPVFAFLDHQSYATRDTLNQNLAKISQDNLSFVNPKDNSLLMGSTESRKLKEDYLTHYFSPWLVSPSNEQLAEIKGDEQELMAQYMKDPGWGENKQPYDSKWIKKILNNINISAYPNLKIRAITLRASSLRMLPTDKPSFTNWTQAGEGYPFDNLQTSILRANMPVIILHTTRDGAWKLVRTSEKSFGWVNSMDLAEVDSHFIKRWQAKHYIMATADDAPIFDANYRFLLSSRIGELFPLYKEGQGHHFIYIAAADSNGHAVIKKALISKNKIIHWPAAITQQNIAHFANNLLAGPYGWGDLYGYRDCSSTQKDLFAQFGIWLPRNSSDQAHNYQFISLQGLSGLEKIKKINQEGKPFLTLLWIPGHIMLYIGEKNGQAYVFHSPWGLHIENLKTGKEGRAIIGRTIIMPLDIDSHYVNIKHKLIEKVAGMSTLSL